VAVGGALGTTRSRAEQQLEEALLW